MKNKNFIFRDSDLWDLVLKGQYFNFHFDKIDFDCLYENNEEFFYAVEGFYTVVEGFKYLNPAFEGGDFVFAVKTLYGYYKKALDAVYNNGFETDEGFEAACDALTWLRDEIRIFIINCPEYAKVLF